MHTSLSAEELTSYVRHQTSALFPDQTDRRDRLQAGVGRALERIEHSFSRVKLKYFTKDGKTSFDHLHTDQYAMFLYFLSNSLYRMDADPRLASRIYALNKALHGIDAFYEVELPEVFVFQHPVGTVLGRATYGNYLIVYQRCSVGSNLDGAYPVIREGVVMFGGSAIIGSSTVGPNSWLSLGATVMDAVVPANSLVFGHSPNLVIKSTRRDVVRDYFVRA